MIRPRDAALFLDVAVVDTSATRTLGAAVISLLGVARHLGLGWLTTSWGVAVFSY